MKTTLLASIPTLAVLAILGTGLPAAYAAATPCEDALQQLREREASSPASDGNKAQYEALKNKGIERCNADDDERADEFFARAMRLLDSK